ncbi:MAG TPA: DUF4434 domain-containing protein [Candidatus Hydrogenedentes bacterium]|nr:DUF4434 domain-containing protein [Candidatus Hydrogenedentota bacterium]
MNSDAPHRADHASKEKHLMNTQKTALSCPPLIRGHLRWYDHAFAMREGIDGWRRELDDERRIGANLLWLSHVRPALDAKDADTLRDIFDACAERGMGVIIETGKTRDWYIHCDVKRELDEVRAVCAMLAERYGDHPAFFAWYVHHEIYAAWDAFGAYIDELYPAAVAACKKALPDKPVTLSPFFILDKDKVFGDFRYAEPQEYREYWARLIRRSGFDIIMLQDSGEHFSYVTMEQRRPFFEAMRGACAEAGATLWGNVETAEMVVESIEKYVARYGRVHHANAKGIPWRNVPIDRLEQKLRLAAEYAENIVSWGYCQFGRPHLNAEAKQWYEEYKRYHDRVAASIEMDGGFDG